MGSLEDIKEPINLADPDAKAKLELKKLVGEHSRGEKLQNAYTQTLVVGIWILAGIAILAAVLRVVHLILPENNCWLNEKQLDLLDASIKYIVTGSIGAYVGNTFKGKK